MTRHSHPSRRKTPILLSIALLSACSQEITWTEGIWTTVEQGASEDQDQCGLIPLFETLEPFTFNVGAANRNSSDDDNSSGPSIDPDEIHDSESSPAGLLTDSALDAGRANIWTLCNDSPSPDFYCDTTLQMLHQEQWIADAVKAFCGEEVDLSETRIRGLYSDGLLLNSEEILINSNIQIHCTGSEEDYIDGSECDSRYTTRLRPQAN